MTTAANRPHIEWSLGKKIGAGFAVALIMMIGIGLTSSRALKNYREALEWRRHSYLVMDNLERVLSLMKDAETGNRGFIITGKDSYLGPYTNSIRELPDRLQNLRHLAADNESQSARLQLLAPAVERRLSLLDQGIVLRRTAGFEDARGIVLQGEGKILMDSIRTIVGEMKGEEETLLQQRDEAVQSGEQQTLATIIIGTGISFIFIVIIGVALVRSITRTLRSLVEGTEQISRGNFSHRVAVGTNDELQHLAASFNGMTVRLKEGTEAMEERDRFFQLSNSLLCIAGFDGYFKRLNPVWESTFGFSFEELLSHPFIDFVYPDDRDITLRELGRLTEGEIAVNFENRYRCKDGSYKWLLWNSTADMSHGVIYATARDVTDLKNAEERVIAANRELETRNDRLLQLNKELEAFSYSVSHDLRAPLRGINGFSQALLEDYETQLDATGKDYLKRIRTATQHMSSLINDILELSRLSRSKVNSGPVDLSKLASEISAQLRENEPDRNVTVHIADRLVAAGDDHLLRIVLENLIGNAWKYTARRPAAVIEIGSRRDNGSEIFYVRDNGAGFDMAYADKLFGAFQRLHAPADFPGNGIGLAIVQRIISRHGGKVWAESTPDQGATFYFALGTVR